MLLYNKRKPTFQGMKVKGSERVNRNVEKEKETLTSHKSVTAGITGKVDRFTPQAPCSQITVSLLQQGITGNTGLMTRQLKIHYNLHFVCFLC